MTTTVLTPLEAPGFFKDISIRAIKDVRALDVDLLFVLQDGRRVIISGGAMKALNDPDSVLMFADGQLPLARVFQQIDQINVSPEANLTVTSKEITRYNQNNAKIEKAKPQEPEADKPVIVEDGPTEPTVAIATNGQAGNTVAPEMTPIKSPDNQQQLADVEVNSDHEKNWGVQWPIAAGVMALLAATAAGGGGGSAAGTAASKGAAAGTSSSEGAATASGDAGQAVITGAAMLGPLNNAVVTVYDRSGNVLSNTARVVDGKYSVTLNNAGYKGAMMIVIRDDTPGVADNFPDEGSMKLADLGAAPLRALAVANGVNQTVNVTALTELATLKAGVAAGVTNLSPYGNVTDELIDKINSAVGGFFKVDALAGQVVPTVALNARGQAVDNPAFSNGISTEAQNYGAALKAISNLVQLDGASYPNQMVAIQKLADNLQLTGPNKDILKWATNSAGLALAGSSKLQGHLFAESLTQIINDPFSSVEAIEAARAKYQSLQNLPNGSTISEYLMKNHVAIANPNIYIKQAVMTDPEIWQTAPPNGTLALDQGDFLDGGLEVKTPPFSTVKVSFQGKDLQGQDFSIVMPSSQADASGQALIVADQNAADNLLLLDSSQPITAQVTVSDGYNTRTNYGVWKDNADVRVDLTTPPGMTKFASPTLTLVDDSRYSGNNGDDPLPFPRAGGEADKITRNGSVGVLLNKALAGNERLQFTVATAADSEGSPIYGPWKEAARLVANAPNAAGQVGYVAEDVVQTNGPNWVKARVVLVGNQYTGGYGNANTLVTPLQFTLDTVAPPQIALQMSGGRDDGLSRSDGISRQTGTTLALAGAPELGAELHFSLQPGSGTDARTLQLTSGSGPAQAVQIGQWYKLNPGDSLVLAGDTLGANGKATIVLRHIDTAGNFNENRQTFIIDSTGLIEQAVMLANLQKAVNEAQGGVNLARAAFDTADATDKVTRQAALVTAQGALTTAQSALEAGLAQARGALLNADGSTALDAIMGNPVQRAYVPAIVNALAATADRSRVDDAQGVQNVVTAAIRAADAAVAKASVYGDDPGNPAPTLDDFNAMGVIGVKSGVSLSSINDALRVLPREQSNSITLIQATADGYNKLLALADGKAGNTSDAALPGVADYAAMGVTPALSPTAARILGQLIDGKSIAEVATVAQVSTLALAAQRIAQQAELPVGQTLPQPLTADDFVVLGIGGVSADNVNDIANGLNSVPQALRDNGSVVGPVDSLSEIRSVVAANIGSLQIIINFAQGVKPIDPTHPAQLTPSPGNYLSNALLGTATTRVDESNVAGINSIVKAVGADAVRSWRKLAALVQSYDLLLSLADGVGGNGVQMPTLDDWERVGVLALKTTFPDPGDATARGNALELLNQVVDASRAAQITGVDKLRELASAAVKVVQLTRDAHSELSASELNSLGLGLTVTQSQMPVVISGIAGSGSDGAGIHTLATLTGVTQRAISAFARIVAYAGDNTKPVPTANDFRDLGIKGVGDDAHVNALNSALSANTAASHAISTPQQVQLIADAYADVLAKVADVAGTHPNPPLADYVTIGTLAPRGDQAIALLDSALVGKSMTQVGTVNALNQLVSSANAVNALAAGDTRGLSGTDLSTQYADLKTKLTLLGVSGMDDGSMSAVFNAIRGSADDGSEVDTVAKLQAVVDVARVAQVKINAYADDATQPAPTLTDYDAIGVTQVDAGNLAAINSALASAPVTSAQTSSAQLVQAIVNAYGVILAAADGVAGNMRAAPTPADYALIGLPPDLVAALQPGSDGKASTLLGMLNTLIDAKPAAAVKSVEAISELGQIAQHVLAQAKGSAGDVLVTQDELTKAGISGLQSHTFPAVLSAIAASADDGSGVIGSLPGGRLKLQILAENATTAQLKIDRYADGTAGALPPQATDYKSVGVDLTVLVRHAPLDTAVKAINSVLQTEAIGSAQVNLPSALVDIAQAYDVVLAAAHGAFLAEGTVSAEAKLVDADLLAKLGVQGLNSHDAATQQLMLKEFQAVLDGMTPAQAAVAANLQATVKSIAQLSLLADGTAGNAADADRFAQPLAGLQAVGVNVADATVAVAALTAIDGLNFAQIATPQSLQRVVDAYAHILAEANETEPPPGTDYTNEDRIPALSSTVHPTQGDFVALGANLPGLTQSPGSAADQAARLSLMDDILKRKARSQVSKVADLNQIGQAVDHVMSVATSAVAGGAAALSDEQLRQWVADFRVMGVTGVDAGTDGNLELILARMGGIGLDQAKTVPQIQAIVDGVNRALLVIQNYAIDSTRNPAPTINDYRSAGITGAASVDGSNLAFINAVVAGLNRTDVDTRSKVFAIVNASNAILAAADGESGNASGAALVPEQYLVLGVPLSSPAIGMGSLSRTSDGMLHLVGADANKIALLNSIVGAATRDAISSPAKLTAFAATAADLIRLAKEDNTDPVAGSTGGSLSVASLQAIGLRAITSETIQAAFLDAVKYKGNQLIAGTNPPKSSDAASTHDVSGVNSIGKLNTIASSVAKVLAYANGAGTAADAPTLDDYLHIGVVMPDSSPATEASALNLLNSIVHAQRDVTRIATVGQLNQLASYVDQIMQVASVAPLADTNPVRYPAVVSTLTPANLSALGLTGMTSASMPAFLSKLQSTADDGSGASSLAALQAMSDGAIAAQKKILQFAQSNAGDPPTAEDFAALALPLPKDGTGSSAAYLVAVNDALKSTVIDASKVQTPAQLQALMTAAQHVVDAANGVVGDAAPRPTADDFLALGLDKRKLDSAGASGQSMLADTIDASTMAGLSKDALGRPIALPDKLAELLDVIRVVTASGSLPSPPPDANALAGLGISFAAVAHNADGSVQNWPAILAAIANSKHDGTQIDSLAKLQALVNHADASYTLIRKYADDSSQPAPAAQDYANVGVVLPTTPPAVGADILNAVNQALASTPVGAPQVETPALLQGIVNTQARLLGMADGNANTAAVNLPTAQDYLRVGLDPALQAKLSAAPRLALLNALVDEAAAPAAVDNPAALNHLASIANKIQDLVLQRPGQPIPAAGALDDSDFSTLGMPGLSATEMAAIMSALQGRIATSVETPAQWRAIAQTTKAAIDKITHYADSNAGDEPQVADYQTIGVTGVSSSGLNANLHPINAALASDHVTGASVATPQAIQELVNSYTKLLAQADGTPGNTALAALAGSADFTHVGVDLSSFAALDTAAPGAAANAAQLLSTLVDSRSAAEIATPAKLQELASLAEKVALTVQGSATTPLTVADFAAMKLDRVNATNLPTVLAQLGRQNINGSDTNTWSKLADVIFSVTNVPTIDTVAGDDVINASERSAGIILTGTAGRDDSVTLFYPNGAVMKKDIVTQDPRNGTSVWKWSYALTTADWQALGADTANGTVLSITVQSHNRTNGVDSVKVAHSITIDTIPPVYADRPSLSQDTGASATDGITHDGKILVPGGEVGASWSYQIDGGTYQRGTGDSFTVAGDGRHVVKVRQTDAAGNTGPEQSLSFTLDTTLPAAPTLTLHNDTGSSATDKMTKDGTLDVSGLESGASWEYSLDGGVTWSKAAGSSTRLLGAADGGGNTDGIKNVVARQIDLAGNVGASSANFAFTLDTGLPGKPVLRLKNDTGSSSSDLLTSDGTIQVGDLDAGASWQYSTDGGVSWSKGSGSSYEVLGAASGGGNTDGLKTFVARQISAAGAVGPNSDTLSFTLQTTKPAAITAALHQDTGSSSSDKITHDGTVDVSGLGTGTSWQYSLDGGTNWTNGSGTSVRVPGASDGSGNADGIKKLQVRQVDAIGNAGPSSAALAFTLDTTAPAKLKLTLAADSGNSASDAITNNGTFNVSGLEPSASWQYSIDGGSTWTAGSSSSGKLTTDAKVSLVARQIDVAGNIGATSDSLDFTLDSKADAPSIALTNPAGPAPDGASMTTSSGFQMAGIAEKGAKVTVRRADASVLATVTASSTDGSWSTSISSTLTVSGLVKVSGGGSSANGSYTLLSASEVAALAGKFSNDFTDQNKSVLDPSKPVYRMSGAGGNWYVWAALDAGYVISRQSGSDEWYREKASGVSSALQPEAVAGWVADDRTAAAIQTEMAQNGGRSIHQKALPAASVVSVAGQRDSAWEYSVEQTDVAGNTSGKATLKVLVDTATPQQLDLDPATDGTQSSVLSHYSVSDLAGGVSFDAHIVAPRKGTTHYIDIVFSGAGLNVATDHLKLDAPLALDADLEKVTGKTVGGISDVSYAYAAASRTLSMSKSNGANFTAAEVKAILEAVQLQNAAAQPGVRTMQVSLRDAALLSGPVSEASMAVHSNGLFIDADPATPGNQMDSARHVSDPLRWTAGVAFDDSVGAPTSGSIASLRIKLGGAGLDLVNDKLMLDTGINLGSSLATVSGSTVGGIGGISYSYDSGTQTVNLSMSNGAPISGAQVQSLVQAIRIGGTGSQHGVRTAQINVITTTGEVGPPLMTSLTLDNVNPWLDLDRSTIGVQDMSNVALGAATTKAGGRLFPTDVAVMGGNDVASIGIQMSGPQLDVVHDKLVLDVPVSLDTSLASAGGKEIGGVGRLSYGYDSGTRTLTISKSSAAPLSGVETAAILDALRFQNASPGDGTRVATITLTDVSGKNSISTAKLNVDVNAPTTIKATLLPSTLMGYGSVTVPDHIGPDNPHNLSKGESVDLTALLPSGMTPAAFVASISAISAEWGGVDITGDANTTSSAYATYFTPAAPLTLGHDFTLMHQGGTAVRGGTYSFSSPDGHQLMLTDLGGFVARDSDVYASNGTGLVADYDIGNIRLLYQFNTSSPDTRPAIEVNYDGAHAAAGDAIRLYEGDKLVGSKILDAADVGAGSKTVKVQVSMPLVGEAHLIVPKYVDVAGNTVTGNAVPVALPPPAGIPVLSDLKVTGKDGVAQDINNSDTDYARVNDGSVVFSGTVGGGDPTDTYLVSVTAGGKVLALNSVPAGHFSLASADRILAPDFYNDLTISAVNMGRGANNGQTTVIANQSLGWYWAAQASENISAGDGNDTIMLGGMRNGANTLVQTGLGEDTLELVPSSTSDPSRLAATITDFTPGMDKLKVYGQNITAANLNQYVKASAANETTTKLVVDLDGAGAGTQVYTLYLQNTTYKPDIVPTLFGV